MRPLTFCDLAMFYCGTGGGIRTYYDAKVDWFRRQTQHRYILIVPGRASATRAVAPSVTLVEARGVGVSRRPDGYRVFADFAQIRSAVRRYRPDVLEAGDPWVSGPLALFLRYRDGTPRAVSSFFHSDPIPTYINPVLGRALPRSAASLASRIASRAFYRLQRSYDVTLASSRVCMDRLRQVGVTNVKLTPFGVDPMFFDVARRRADERTNVRPRRLIYVGRLDHDKQVDLLLAVMPRVLETAGVFVTIVGTGALQRSFERWIHPRFRYAGYVRDRHALADLYREHDILLAPGAYETFGLAALEAAAAGLIVVGPDRGGTGALLREMDSPFAFKAGDASDLLMTVRTALDADWPRASRASRALAERYGTWPAAVGRLVDTYHRVLEMGGWRS